MMVGLAIFLLLLLFALIYLWWKFERRIGLHQSTRDFWKLSNLPLPKKIEGYIYASRTEWASHKGIPLDIDRLIQ